MPWKPKPVCAACGHHKSMHEYKENGRGLAGCKLCGCPGWRQPGYYEKITRLPVTKLGPPKT